MMNNILKLYRLFEDGGKLLTEMSLPFMLEKDHTLFKDGDYEIWLSAFTYNADRMGGAPSITATVKSFQCLDNLWGNNVYVEFRGERYFVMNTPSSSKDNDDERYSHDVGFLAEREVLNHVYFIDAVQGESTVDIYKSNTTKVQFMGNIQEFVGRLNACLSYQKLDYKAVIDEGITSEDMLVSFEDKYILEALQEIFNVYKIPYYFVGKTIHIGYTENTITKIFKYGFNEALLSINKENANYAIINKIKGTGSSDNIPYYYPNESDDRQAIEASGKKWITPMTNLMPSIYRESEGAEQFYEAKNNTYLIPESEEYYEFENECSEKNQKQGTTTFEDIKPTIKEMTNAEGLRMDMFSAFAYDMLDSDEVDENGDYVHPYFFAKLRKFDGEFGFNLFDQAIEDETMQISMTSGVCGGCTFEIGVGEDKQKNLVQVDEDGVLLRDDDGNVLWQNQVPQDRQNDTKKYEVWIALKKDNSTYGMVMPNDRSNLKPSIDDTFVILNIDMPLQYVLNAEKKLEESLIKHMWMNNVEKFTFSIKFSRIFFAENPDILSQLNENSRITIEYNGIQHTLYVDNFSYKLSEGDSLPEIEVNLVDTLNVGTNSLQTQLDSVKQDILTSLGGGGDILKAGLKYFIRKDVNDTAKGKISFVKGIDTTDYVANTSGACILKDSEGKWLTEADNATFRGLMYVGGDATVKGTLAVEKDITAQGNASIAGSVSANTLETKGNAHVMGTLTVDGGAQITDGIRTDSVTVTNFEEGVSEKHTSITPTDVETQNLSSVNAQINIINNDNVSDAFHGNNGDFRGYLGSRLFAEGLTGYGWRIDEHGDAWMGGLRLREFLEVPELRYNRITVVTGEQWLSKGGGIIESVDESANTFVLKLEDGEFASIAKDDICKGIYNFSGGFKTAYFKIVSLGADGKTVTYELREGTDVHPQPFMHFVAYGNFTDADRQGSAYATTNYYRFLKNVDDWDITAKNIAMQFGDLTNLKTEYDIDMTGYSAYLQNVYLTGLIKQLSGSGEECVVPAWRGEWQSGTVYYPNDLVKHNGSTWLCVNRTSSEPSKSNADWEVYVEKGDSGDAGTGTGIESITNFYAVSSSNTIVPSSWTTEVPEMTATLRYLWNYERIAYTDGRVTETERRVIGVYGDRGNTGVGIESITEYYLATSQGSGVTTSTAGWTEEVQTITNGKKYLWNYEVVLYTDGSNYTSTPVIIGVYGDKGDDGVAGAMIRMRGEWAQNTQYVNNSDFRDVVLYDSHYKICRQTHNSGTYFNSSYWDEFNEFINVATSVLLADTGYIKILGAGRLFVGRTDTNYGWEMTQGYIKHTSSGLELTYDGKLKSPDGLSLIVGNETLDDYTNGIALSATEEKFNEVTGEVESLSAKITLQDGKIESATQSITETNSRIDGIDSDIDGINTEINTLNTSITQQNGKISLITEDITEIQGSIDGVNSEISSLKSSLTLQGGEITALTESVSNLGTSVGELQVTTDNISLKVSHLWPDNIFPDGDFEMGGKANQNVSNCTPTIDTAEVMFGSNSLKLACQTTSNSWIYLGRGQVPVTAGNTYTIIFWLKGTASFTELGGACGAFFSKDDQLNLAGFTAFQPQITTSWTRLAYAVTAPAESKYLSLRLGVTGQSVARTLYFDGIMVFEGDLTASPPDTFISGENNKLLATGIDIYNNKITVTADQFTVQNNEGETTAKVNADGVLETNGGIFRGLIKRTSIKIDRYNGNDYVKEGTFLGDTIKYVDILDLGGFAVRYTGDFPSLGDYWQNVQLYFAGYGGTNGDNFGDTDTNDKLIELCGLLGTTAVFVNLSQWATDIGFIDNTGTLQSRSLPSNGVAIGELKVSKDTDGSVIVYWDINIYQI